MSNDIMRDLELVRVSVEKIAININSGIGELSKKLLEDICNKLEGSNKMLLGMNERIKEEMKNSPAPSSFIQGVEHEAIKLDNSGKQIERTIRQLPLTGHAEKVGLSELRKQVSEYNKLTGTLIERNRNLGPSVEPEAPKPQTRSPKTPG